MSTTRSESTAERAWRLQDAKGCFSEAVRLARKAGAQRVSIRGKDAVVVRTSDEFGRVRHPGTGADLVRAMADPRVRQLEFDHPKLRPTVRDVHLRRFGRSCCAGVMTMDVFNYLLDHRDAVANIPDHPSSGVYAIFARNGDCVPDIDLPPSGLVYIGLSSDLERRNHFNAPHSGFHSPRRSIGAILKETLNLTAIPRAPGPSKSNYENFRFTQDGEDRLTSWMQSNLEYSIYPFSGDVDELERGLMVENEPPLNLNKWRNPQKQKIEALRKACKQEAKLVWRERYYPS
jgi:hypothetical protein